MEIKTGTVIRNLMRSKGLTLKEISQGSGVPASTLSEWANDRIPKNPSQVQSVAKLLGVTVHYLLFGQEDSEEPITKVLKQEFFTGTFEISIKRVKLAGEEK